MHSPHLERDAKRRVVGWYFDGNLVDAPLALSEERKKLLLLGSRAAYLPYIYARPSLVLTTGFNSVIGQPETNTHLSAVTLTERRDPTEAIEERKLLRPIQAAANLAIRDMVDAVRCSQGIRDQIPLHLARLYIQPATWLAPDLWVPTIEGAVSPR